MAATKAAGAAKRQAAGAASVETEEVVVATKYKVLFSGLTIPGDTAFKDQILTEDQIGADRIDSLLEMNAIEEWDGVDPQGDVAVNERTPQGTTAADVAQQNAGTQSEGSIIVPNPGSTITTLSGVTIPKPPGSSS